MDRLPPTFRHSSTPVELTKVAELRSSGEPVLLWRDGDGRLQSLTLDPAARYSLGRRPSMSVSLAWDAKVSRLHAELECIDGEWVLIDDGLSKNGTSINGELIHQRGRLRHGDQIRIGDTLMEFHAAVEDLELAETAPEDDDQRPSLTARQREALVELCRDWFESGARVPRSDRQIADALVISPNTVKKTLRTCYVKCGYPRHGPGRRVAVMNSVIDRGIVSPSDYR